MVPSALDFVSRHIPSAGMEAAHSPDREVGVVMCAPHWQAVVYSMDKLQTMSKAEEPRTPSPVLKHPHDRVGGGGGLGGRPRVGGSGCSLMGWNGVSETCVSASRGCGWEGSRLEVRLADPLSGWGLQIKVVLVDMLRREAPPRPSLYIYKKKGEGRATAGVRGLARTRAGYCSNALLSSEYVGGCGG
jgi:hypothetical protein